MRLLSTGRLGEGIFIGIKENVFFNFHINKNDALEVNTLLNRFLIDTILSFVENGDSFFWAIEIFPKATSVIPKIETTSAVKNIDSILS